MLKSVFLLPLLFLGGQSHAYLPDYHLIMSRTAENHGRGGYLIEQDLVFRGDPDPLVVKESWILTGENSLRVTFEGKGRLQGQIQGTFVYDHNTRRWIEDGGAVRSSQLGPDWVEPFFHFRYSKNIKPKLVALKIAPAESLRDRTSKVEDNKWVYAPQTFMRLSRTGGTVNYAIGVPTAPDASESHPGLWIEQDQFVIRKLRLPSQALIKADEYTMHSSNLWLPKVRSYSWGGESVQVYISNVRSLGTKGKYLDWLKPSSLEKEKSSARAVKVPEIGAIKEFYSRFR